MDEESGSVFLKTDTFKNSNGEIVHSEITL